MHQHPPPTRPLWQSYALLAASMALVGSYVALSKPLVLLFPVFLLACLRFGIAALALLPWLKRPLDESPLNRQTHFLLFLESFFGNFLFSICMLYGVSMTSAVSAGIILATLPACVALLSWLMLNERISGRVWLAIVCAVLGMGLLTLAQGGATHNSQAGADSSTDTTWLGNLLVFAAVLCEAAYAVIGKCLTGVLSAKRITALINLWGLALMTPLGLYAAWQFDFGVPNIGMWGLLLFYALAASVWTVWLWMTGLQNVPASRAGVFTAMLPISAALVGVLVLGERVSMWQIIAFGLAFMGIILAASRS